MMLMRSCSSIPSSNWDILPLSDPLVRNADCSRTEFSMNESVSSNAQSPESKPPFLSAEYIARFLHIAGGEHVLDPEKFRFAFAQQSEENLLSFVAQLNALARKVPLRRPEKKRAPDYHDPRHTFFKKHMGKFHEEAVGGEDDSTATFYDVVPPVPNISLRLTRNTLIVLKKIIENNNPHAGDVAARTLYHIFHYLQPFPDANLRTGRLMYYLFSPRIVKESRAFRNDIEEILTREPIALDDYNILLRRYVGADMLKARGLPIDYDEQENRFHVHLDCQDSRGFAFAFLGFLALWDTLNPTLRETLKKPIPNTNAFYYAIDDLPDDLRIPFDIHFFNADFAQPVFEEFCQRVIDYGLQTDPPFPEDLQVQLDEAFERFEPSGQSPRT